MKLDRGHVQDDSATRIAEDVSRAARRTAREWAGVIDAEDAEQEIWLRILESSKDYVDQLAEMEPGARQTVLNKVGQQVASKYRDDYEGFSGNYIYGVEEVRGLLRNGALLSADAGEHLIATASGTNVDEDGMTVRQQSMHHDRESVTERIDLRLGLVALADRNSSYFGAVVRAYKLGISPADANGRKTLQRAVDALTSEMNWSFRRRYDEFDGPGKK